MSSGSVPVLIPGEEILLEPDKPENPDQPENPDKPENPDEHTHVYVFDAVVREQEKTMTVSYVCECGDNRTEFVKAEFTSVDDGSGVVLNVSTWQLPWEAAL